jgi:molybdenum cofactor cytidylyltransferase
MEPARVGIVILAAGGSQRMGRPKQLLPFHGRTVIRHVVEAAVASVCRPIVVVIGAHSELVGRELHSLPVTIACNPEWQLGMGSSLRVAIQTLEMARIGDVDGALITLSDQPLVTAGAIDRIVEIHYQSGKAIVASEYADTHGVPVFISRRFFDEVAALNESEGARRVIARHLEEVVTVPLLEAALDIDTPADYEKLTGNQV